MNDAAEVNPTGLNPTGPHRCPVLPGGVPLTLRLRYAETTAYFDRFRTDAAPVSASPLSAAPLGGLIVLRRDGFNAFESIDAQRAAPYVFASVFQSCETEDSIRRAANAASRLLESAAVYRLTSRDVPDSTRLMADALCKEAIVP